MDFAKIKSSFDKVQVKSKEQKPNLELIKKMKTESIYQMFKRLALEVDDVELEGKLYPAGDLITLIEDMAVSLSWKREEGWKIKPQDDFKKYKEFRSKYLIPNVKQVKHLIKLANEEIQDQLQQLEGRI